MRRIGARHRLAAQKVAAVRIRQGQRLAARPVAGPEPALEVDAPHVVGRATRRKRHGPRRRAAAQAALSPSGPRGRTEPRSCSPPATPRPDRDARATPEPSQDPSADAHAEPPGTQPRSRRTQRADAAQARARGPIDPKPPPDDSAHTTCNRHDGSHRSDGRAPQTSPHPPQPPARNAAVPPKHRSPSKPSARPSSPTIRPVTHVAGLFRYLCRRFGPRPDPLPAGERGDSRRAAPPFLLPSRLREGPGGGLVKPGRGWDCGTPVPYPVMLAKAAHDGGGKMRDGPEKGGHARPTASRPARRERRIAMTVSLKDMMADLDPARRGSSPRSASRASSTATRTRAGSTRR